jgi:hypothetical protein
MNFEQIKQHLSVDETFEQTCGDWASWGVADDTILMVKTPEDQCFDRVTYVQQYHDQLEGYDYIVIQLDGDPSNPINMLIDGTVEVQVYKLVNQ